MNRAQWAVEIGDEPVRARGAAPDAVLSCSRRVAGIVELGRRETRTGATRPSCGRAHAARTWPWIGRPLSHLTDFVVDDIRSNDLADVVLVAHSGAGPIAQGVAEKSPQRLRRLVFLD